jgi:ATP-binding cassette, subfamily A (ABC1), member 3
MGSFSVNAFIRQTKALAYKNFLVGVLRHPFAFFIKGYLLPIGFLALLLSIPTLTTRNNRNGVGEPASLPSLASVIPSDKTLFLVRPPGLGSDVDDVIRKVTGPLRDGSFKILEKDDELSNVCLANLRGIIGCHAAVTFNDSPLTVGGGRNHTWNYTMRGDPARDGSNFAANSHDNDQERIYLPLQVALENAMTGSTANPQMMLFTYTSQEMQDRRNREDKVLLVSAIYPFALMACFLMGVYQITTQISKERENGMSHLVDAMGGSSSARVLSYLIVYDLAYLPSWIAFGILYWKLIWPTSPGGILICWQILLGLAVNSSCIFAAAFFKKSRASAIYVIGAFLLLSIAGQLYGFSEKPSIGGVTALTLLFPSCNHYYFTQYAAIFEYSSKPIDLNERSAGLYSDPEFGPKVVGSTLWGYLVVQIFVYPLVAILVEHFMHGISFKKRTFSGGKGEGSSIVVETTDLKKRFMPTWTELIFCCGRKKSVVAVDGVSLQGHKGQILCLVGPNGSGKTTTLQMIAGFIPSTEGSVKIDALPSQLGICPQQNTSWDDLTVKEHVRIWNQIKAGREDAQSLDQLINSCDLEGKVNSRAGTLSGGQKRKLQLACMFVGNSSVCLIDECTSGLDPLSRRVIWDILMEQRARRSIIFTTHFLDEVEVLADHIVILSKGKVRCQGPSTELKHLYGGGYKVLVPRSEGGRGVPWPATTHQDQIVYTTPDSKSAADLTRQFAAEGVVDVSIAGPQVEDVFLRVADEPELTSNLESQTSQTGMDLTPGEVTSFWSQVWALLWKRVHILKRFFWPYLWVICIPLIAIPLLADTLKKYERPSCAFILPELSTASEYKVYFYKSSSRYYAYTGPRLLIGGSQAIDEGIHNVLSSNFSIATYFNMSLYEDFKWRVGARQEFMDVLHANTTDLLGGLFWDGNGSDPLIGYQADVYSRVRDTGGMVNLWSQARSGMEIVFSYGQFAQTRRVSHLLVTRQRQRPRLTIT